jgi:predicted dehydrogenase
MVRVAIIGAGYIGRIHAHILHHQVKNASVIAVFDTVHQKGRELAEEVQAPFHEDVRVMLESENIDAVALCTPTSTHFEYVKLIAEYGKHLFCEKPLASTLNDADGIIDIVHKSGIQAMSGHVLRFWPEYVRAREILKSGELGNPLHVYCERLVALPDWQEGAWHIKQKQGAGAALDVQIHDLDYLNWLFDDPRTLRSEGIYNDDYGGWMHMQSRIEFGEGQYGHVQAGWGFPPAYPFTQTLRILCDGGTVEWNFKAGKLLENRGRPAPLSVYKKDGQCTIEKVDQTDPFLLQWNYFIDCIEKKGEILRATFEEGRRALKLAFATIESARTKKEVRINW